MSVPSSNIDPDRGPSEKRASRFSWMAFWRQSVVTLGALALAPLPIISSVVTTGYDSVFWHSARSVAMGEPLPLLRIGEQRIYTGCGATERVEIARPDVTLVGEVYSGTETEERPIIVLMHGSTPLGRKLGLYRVLSCELSSEGYLVLAIDQRDVGESGLTPDSELTVDAEIADVQAILDALSERSGVADGQVYVVAHSMGGAVAMAAAATGNADGARAMVAIGPSRRVVERILAPDAPDFDKFYERSIAHTRRSDPVDEQFFRDRLQLRALETHQEFWNRPGHIPLLLLDGEHEDDADLEFLSDYYDFMSPPKRYFTQPGVAHYVGTHGLTPSNSLVLYDQGRMDELVEYIDEWIREYDGD